MKDVWSPNYGHIFSTLLIRAGTSVCPRTQCQVIPSDVVVAVGEDEMYFPGHKDQQCTS